MIKCSLLLRRALAADAAASGVLGLAMAFAPAALADLLQLPSALLLKAGMFLIPYAILVGWMASREFLPHRLVQLVIVGNVLWTAGSAALLAAALVTPNVLGTVFVAVQAAAVCVFAELEFFGLRRSAPAIA